MASASSSTASCTTRSRTGLFLSYRESIPRRRTRNDTAYADDEENERLIASPGHAEVDMPLPPKWVDYSEQVELILADTRAKITALDKLHAKHLLPGFSDRTQEERDIENLTTEITRDFRQCQGLIKKIGAPSHVFPPNGSEAHTDALATKNIQRGLAVKVQDLSAAFRKKQRVYMEKLQGHSIKNQDLMMASGAISLRGSAGMSAVDEDLAAATHTRSQSLSISQQQLQSQLQSQTLVADNDTEIASRTHSLNELADSIASLAELFKDLSSLIIDQGTLLDSIEYNIEQTAVDVKSAATELTVAEGYQKRTGRRYCILLLVLLIILAATGVVIKIQRSGKAKQVPPPPSPTITGTTGITVVEPVIGSGSAGGLGIGGRAQGGEDYDIFRRPRFSSRILPRSRWREYGIPRT